VEAGAGHGEGQGGAHEFQRVEADVVHKRRGRSEDGKGLLEGAVMASSPAGRKMADSTSYLADSSLKWLREVG
jgi:hypothetical protein